MNSDVVLAGVDVSSFFVFLGEYVRLVKDVGVERLQGCIWPVLTVKLRAVRKELMQKSTV